MEKINIGMYVRTKDGIIDKVIIDYNGHCASPNCECKHVSCAKNYYDEDNIVKASYNIIDILEVGDYVNGYPVTAILSSNNKVYEIQVKRPNNRNGVWIENIKKNEDIKSILTDEQFKNMEYRIGE